ncbi:MAG: AAA family ATPase [Acidobacteriia bacterium]|nr:AAA family ATPase [Terriglobia bacterium]
MKTIAFFNSKGGVGKTTLVYHLAWMFADMGLSVVAADLDPQSNLSGMFLEEDRLIELWSDVKHPVTILGAIESDMRGISDIQIPHVEPINRRIGLIVGDLGLSAFEDKLSEAWQRCRTQDEAAFRVTTALYRAVLVAAEQGEADVVMIDVASNLGAINRSALIASQHVVIPLGLDLFSLQGLRSLGPALHAWRNEWKELRRRTPDREFPLPDGNMRPAGYLLMQVDTRPALRAWHRWAGRIPTEYQASILGVAGNEDLDTVHDPHCLAGLMHYGSLMSMAKEARKPMFSLKPADGAIGAHVAAVRDCYSQFKTLAERILRAVEE